MPKQIIKAIPRTWFNATLLGAYSPINPLGLPESCFMLRIINASKGFVFISFDGIDDHNYLKLGESITYYGLNSKQESRVIGAFSKGLKVYVGGPPILGYIYLCGYYV